MKFIHFAESKVEDGTMKKNRLIHPGQRRLLKWITSLGSEDSTVGSNTPDSLEGGMNTVYLGSGFNRRKDPEHLPPTTLFQRVGNGIRTIPHVFGSTESAFGIRVACKFNSLSVVEPFCSFFSGDYDYRNCGILEEHANLLPRATACLGTYYDKARQYHDLHSGGVLISAV